MIGFFSSRCKYLSLVDLSSISGMNLQQVPQPRSSSNGYGRRRTERESGSRLEHKLQSGRTNLRRPTNAGVQAGNKGSGYGSLSRERLVYLTTCLIGHNVEVQVKDGSLISGIFHATNAEKDFGIILKMASEIRSGPSRGKKSISNFVSKAPSKTLIIPAEELVQITAKDVSVTRNGVTNDLQLVKQQDILIDSSISQSRHVDGERALERWVPNEDDPECPELESIFDGHWNRGWDQFEVNETLFGVKSTFDEELYTTKLDRGPQMRDLEREASRLAREIEGEDTLDLHLAEERGIQLHGSLDIDEETRFSSVLRGVDDSGYDENEDVWLKSCDETFGSAPGSVVCRSFADLASGKNNEGAQVSYGSASMDEVQSSLSSTARDLQPPSSSDYSGQPSSEFLPQSCVLDSESRIQEHRFSGQHAGSTYVKDFVDKQMLSEESQMLKYGDSQSSLRAKKDDHNVGKLSPDATSYAPTSIGTSSEENKSSHKEVPEDSAPVKTQGAKQSTTSRGRPGSSTSSTSDCGGVASASSGPVLSPSSSVVSLSSEKSTLNPYAKEFKLNPNAKSFVPSQSPLRPASPVSDGSFYFPSVPHMHNMPVGMGIGPSFAHQPVMFNPPVAPMQSPQAYFHPHGPQFGQQMILGHPRQVLYMPTYPPVRTLDSL
ncbi:polyadenylate-binding protein-interacting protein 4-like isoform X3 [Rhododendron vialii]|uniref:polyadenylate-binding protein-interacting protein 4-like isoform X3 n=1 Tax=Rhododendron vialii TaxID=182163 RepID=UPI00266012E4|nr:polyadenylate-binding protein-interacting protein 4-like isoform X3 [Rhododendron vialii]